MTSRPLGETFKRAVDANLEYYKGLIQLATNYARSLSAAIAPVDEPARPAPSPSSAGAARATAAPAAENGAPADAELVLEGEAGALVQGVFRVTNTLAHEVTAAIRATPVLDPQGRPVEIALAATPGVVTLAPRASQTVTVSAEIPDAMNAGETCRTLLQVPGLATHGVGVLIRCSGLPAAPPNGASKHPKSKSSAPARRAKKPAKGKR